MSEKIKFSLYDYRQRGLVNMEDTYEPLTIKQMVMAKCLECCGFEITEAHICDIKSCPLNSLCKKWMPSKLKLGISHGPLSEEHKQKMQEARRKNL